MGAALHVGRCRVMYPDAAMRAACYQAVWQDDLFRQAHRLLRSVTDSGGAFLLVWVLLLALGDVPTDSAMAALSGLAGSLIPEKLISALGSRREDILQALTARVAQGYRLASEGQEPPKETLNVLRGRMAALILRYGGAQFVKAALSCLALSHRLRGSYKYIVTERFGDLVQRLWQPPVSAMEQPERGTARRLPGGRYRGLSEGRKQRNRVRLNE